MADIIAVVTDLFFQARISAASKAAGTQVQFVSSDVALRGVTNSGLALVDLDASLDVLSAIRALKINGAPVIAFGPHLDTASRKAARAAGADRVLAKSKFVTELPQLIGEILHHVHRQGDLGAGDSSPR